MVDGLLLVTLAIMVVKAPPVGYSRLIKTNSVCCHVRRADRCKAVKRLGGRYPARGISCEILEKTTKTYKVIEK